MKIWWKRNPRRHARRNSWQMVSERLEDRTLLAAPTLDIPISNQIVGVQSAFQFSVSTNTFSDADPGELLTLTATLSNGDPLPAWLSFLPASPAIHPTGIFSGTPLASDVGAINVKVIATDPGNATAEDVFQITIPPNQVPSFIAGPNQTVLEDAGPQIVVGESVIAFTQGQDINVSKLLGSQTEVHIAINPKNPQNLVIVSNGGTTDPSAEFIANSFDGGISWTIRELGIAQDGINGANPFRFDGAVAFDRFGNVHVVYMADPDGSLPNAQRTSAIVYASSNDGGSTFSTRILAATATNIDKPWIATGPDAANPEIDAVFVTYRNTSKFLVAQGAKVTGLASVGVFSAPTSLNAPTTAQFAVPSVGPKGEFAVTYMDPASGSSEVKFTRDLNGLLDGFLTFETPTKISTTQVHYITFVPATPDRGTIASPYLAYDQSPGPFRGRLYCAYADSPNIGSTNTNIFLRYSKDNGTTWSSAVRVNDDTSVNSQFLQNISVDPVTGHVFLSWYDARNDKISGAGIDSDGVVNTDTQYFASASIDGGVTFITNLQVSQSTSNQLRDHDPNMTSDPNDYGDYSGIAVYNDVAHVVWADNSNSTNDNPNGDKSFDVYTDRVTLSVVPGWATNIRPGPANELGQTVDFIVTTGNPALFSVQPAISSAGILSYTPAPNANGVANVTVKIHDNGGTNSGGVDTSAPQVFQITVTAVNDAPSFTKGANQLVNVSAGAQSIVGWATVISAGPNEASQTVDFIVTTSNDNLFAVKPSISPNGTLTFTPAVSFGGSATVTVKLHDDGGTANGGIDTSNAQIFNITTFVPNVVYTAVGSSRVRAVVINGQLKVQINGIDYSSYQSAFIETLTINGGTSKDEVDLTGLSAALYPKLTKIVLKGGAGNDSLIGTDIDLPVDVMQTINGDAGNDTLSGGLGDDMLNGGAGTDLLIQSGDKNLTLTNTSLTGLGTDSLTGIENVFLTGGVSANKLDASAFMLGSVTLIGGAGNDTLLGGSKNDFLSGQADDDSMQGGDGNDTISGGIGKDKLNGDAGNDLLIGGFGDDTIDGGAGTDIAVGGQGGQARNGNSQKDAGDMILAGTEHINELFAKLFAWE